MRKKFSWLVDNTDESERVTHILGWIHVADRICLLRIGHNSILVKNVSFKLDFSFRKFAFFSIKSCSCTLKFLKYLLVFCLRFTTYKNILNVRYLTFYAFQYYPKGHTIEAESSKWCDKGFQRAGDFIKLFLTESRVAV